MVFNREGNWEMSESLYERLGRSEGITRIANDVVDNHSRNERISRRFADSDMDKLKKMAAEFFIKGSGGPNVYKGKDMIAAHRGLNIDSDEFLTVLDDTMDALDKNGVGQREKEEVLSVLFSLKDQVMRQ